MSPSPSAPAAETVKRTPNRDSSSDSPRRKVFRRIAALAVTGLAFYVLLPSVSRVVGAWPRLATLSPAWFAAAVVAEVLSFACTFALQRIALRTTGWFAVVAAGLSGNAVTNVVPGGDAVGAAVQFRMLATAGIDADTAAGGLTATSLLSVGGLLALPIFALPAILGGTGVSRGLGHAALLGLGVFGLYVIVGVVLMTTDRLLIIVGSIVQRLLNMIPRRRTKTEDLGARLVNQRNAIRSALGRNWWMAILLIVGRLGFDYLCLLGVLRATGDSPRPSLVLLAYAIAGVIALVPLTPGGLGIVEASLSGLLVLAGIPGGTAFLATLAYRLISYWLPLLAGPVIYVFYRRRYGPVQLTNSDLASPKHSVQ